MNSFILLSFQLALIGIISFTTSDCPKSSGDFRRLGNTRFFIIHAKNRGNKISKSKAKQACEKRGLIQPKIKNMVTMALLGRPLEKLAYDLRLRDTWYWLDSNYDYKSNQYFWGPTSGGELVEYGSYLFRHPRPTGIGTHIDYKGVHKPDSDVPQCLTLALPNPWFELRNTSKNTVYGFHITLDERPCESEQSRQAICESPDPACKFIPPSENAAFYLTEDKMDYFEDGLWIFGDRKYLVNWKHRNINQTIEYCKSFGLKVFRPSKTEWKLIPMIKAWSREITNSQWWTGFQYNVKTTEVFDEDGKWVSNNTFHGIELQPANIQKSPETRSKTPDGKKREPPKPTRRSKRAAGRSSKDDQLMCVHMDLAYEFKGQQPCPPDKDPLGTFCAWAFILFQPGNCKDYKATICQHSDHEERKMPFKQIDAQDLTEFLHENALSEFGFKGNTKVMRSRYKQTFASLYCAPTYRMLRSDGEKNTKWAEKPAGKEVYEYDYTETYWVVDGEKFDKNEKKQCTVSHYDKKAKKRSFKKVSCGEWHFYLCEKLNHPIKKPKKETMIPDKKMQWKEGPQPRVYKADSRSQKAR